MFLSELMGVLYPEIQFVVTDVYLVSTYTVVCIGIAESRIGCMGDVPIEVGDIRTNGKVVEHLVS